LKNNVKEEWNNFIFPPLAVAVAANDHTYYAQTPFPFFVIFFVIQLFLTVKITGLFSRFFAFYLLLRYELVRYTESI
jgi:hypothetical protein